MAARSCPYRIACKLFFPVIYNLRVYYRVARLQCGRSSGYVNRNDFSVYVTNF